MNTNQDQSNVKATKPRAKKAQVPKAENQVIMQQPQPHVNQPIIIPSVKEQPKPKKKAIKKEEIKQAIDIAEQKQPKTVQKKKV